MKNKYIFLGEVNSINLELIFKSFNKFINKVNYIIIGDLREVICHIRLLKKNIKINIINDPLNFEILEKKKINFFDIAPTKIKFKNHIAQIKFCNFLSNITGNDLITMPINKFNFKKHMNFKGMTEYLGSINRVETLMLMKGDVFSIIPITTHIKLSDVTKNFKKKLFLFLKVFRNTYFKLHSLYDYKEIVFLCLNPHCSEDGTLGHEDKFLIKNLKKYFNKSIKFKAADSAFNNINKHSLFVAFYHDQALIPFKILNKKSFNYTVGLKYRRFSPAHGTANDIKFQNVADNTSYIECMLS